jgi:hypothetical protein
MDKQAAYAATATSNAQKAEDEAFAKTNALLLSGISLKIKSNPTMDMTSIPRAEAQGLSHPATGIPRFCTEGVELFSNVFHNRTSAAVSRPKGQIPDST